MRNVLHIANGFSTSQLYNELIRRLNDEYIRSIVIAPVYNLMNDKAYSYPVFQYLRDKSLISRLRFYRKIDNIWSFVKENISEIKNIDLIHAHTLFSDGAVALKANQEYGIPYIVAIRNTDINCFFKYFFFLHKLGHSILVNAKKIILLSPIYRQRLQSVIPHNIFEQIKDKIEVIPNGVNDFWIENKQHDKHEPKKSLRLIYCGMMDENKNILRIIDAATIVNEKYPIELRLIGKSSTDNERYIRKIENRIKKEKLDIRLIDSLNKEQLIEHYRWANIFVMPSHTETFGLVYAEALSQNLPLIYTRNEGFDGYFPEGEVGYSVNSKSVEDIAEKIIRIHDDYSNISSKVSNVDITLFSWDYIAAKYNGIYDNILSVG